MAALAQARGALASATAHLDHAYAWFATLEGTKYLERTAQLAREYGLTLAETPASDM